MPPRLELGGSPSGGLLRSRRWILCLARGSLFLVACVAVLTGSDVWGSTTLDPQESPFQDTVIVRGRVVDADGLPVPRAGILALCFDPADRSDRDRLPTLARCDDTGCFVLEGLTRGRSLYVQAAAEGFLSSTDDTLHRLDQDLSLPDLVLNEADGRLEGRVLDMEGRPIADVEVLASRRIGNRDLEPREFHDRLADAGFLRRTHTDAQGRFAFEKVRLGADEKSTKLRLRSEGRALQVVPEVSLDGEPLTLRMGARPRIELRVDGLDEGATAQVFVDRFLPDLALERVERSSGVPEAELQVGGGVEGVSVELSHAPSLVRVLVVSTHGVRVQDVKRLGPGEIWKPVLRLPAVAPALWTAQVVDHTSGAPIRGASVQQIAPGRPPDLMASSPRQTDLLIRADAEGRFEFVAEPAAPRALVVRCPGYANQAVLADSLRGAAGELRIPLVRGASLEVEVEYPADRWPAQNLLLHGDRWDLPPVERSRAGVVEALPRFEGPSLGGALMLEPKASFEHLPPGHYRAELTALADDPQRWSGDVLRHVTVTDGERRSIRFEDSEPASRAHLELTLCVDGLPLAGAEATLRLEPLGISRDADSDADGTWRFTHLPPGQLLQLGGTRHAGIPRLLLDALEPGEARVHELSFCHTEFDVEVLDATSGEPLPGAEAHLQGHATPWWAEDGTLQLDHWRDRGSPRPTGIADADGRLRLRLRTGRWSYRIEHPGHVPATVEWRVGEEPTPGASVVRLQPARRRLVLRTPRWMQGRARPRLAAWVWRCDGSERFEEPDLRVSARWDDDTLVFDTLPSGALELLVVPDRQRDPLAGGIASSRLQVDLPETGTVHDTVPLEPGCSVVVRLEAPDGSPRHGFEIEAREQTGLTLARLARWSHRPVNAADSIDWVDGAEVFPFPDLPSRAVVFHVLKDGKEHSRHAVTLPLRSIRRALSLALTLED